MHLAALHQGRVAEDRTHGLPQGLRAVEDDQQTPVRAQTAALQISQQVLTHARVLRRAVPQAERLFLAIRRDPERHDEAMLANVHAVDQQADQVEALERGGLPGRQLRRGLRHEATTHGTLARAAAPHRRRHRLQTARIAPRGNADQHLLHHPAIQRVDIGHRLEGGQGHLLAIGAHARAAHDDLPAAEHHLTAHRAGARGLAVSDVHIPRTAQRDAILLKHRVQHLQT